MFETFQRLHHWLQANDITKPVVVTFYADALTVDHIGCLLRDEGNKASLHLPRTEPVLEGQLYGITFKLVARISP